MKVVCFILLKIIEVLALIFIPYLLGMAFEKIWPCDPVCTGGGLWVHGGALFSVPVCIVVLCFCIFMLVKENWALAGKLKKKIKGEPK